MERERILGHVGERLRQGRLDRGLTLRALAKRCGVPYTTLCVYELGDMEAGVVNLTKVCSALGIRDVLPDVGHAGDDL
jgi:transcriptional regulator with XRE-family HTH domain